MAVTDSPEDRRYSLTYAALVAEARAARGDDGDGARRVSPTIAYLLWLFLGWFGVHRLYLGRVPSALAMMIVAAAGIGLGVSGRGFWLTIPLGFWVLFDGTQIAKWLTAVNRRPR